MRVAAMVRPIPLRQAQVRMSSMAEQPLSQTASAVVNRFFESYQRSDWQSMARCYHDKASFSDPIYPDLREENIVYLWFSRLSKHQSIDLQYRVVFADERKAQVEWTAISPFNGKAVKIEGLSTFALWDETIVRHVDEFSFVKWSRQAQGLKGWLLGGSRFYQARVQRSARSQLEQVAGTIG